jgi:hypothetical protein
MGMKLTHSHLEAIKKQLVASNKALVKLNPINTAIGKLIKDNEKQIKILTDEYFID